MSKFSYIGAIENIDYDNNIVSIKIDFITPEDLFLLEELRDKKEFRKFTHSSVSVDSQSYKLQKAWYGSLNQILKYQEIIPTAENLEYFDEEMRKAIFPAKAIYIDDNEIYVPKRMKELNNEERYRCVIKLQERYDFVDWSQFWK